MIAKNQHPFNKRLCWRDKAGLSRISQSEKQECIKSVRIEWQTCTKDKKPFRQAKWDKIIDHNKEEEQLHVDDFNNRQVHPVWQAGSTDRQVQRKTGSILIPLSNIPLSDRQVRRRWKNNRQVRRQTGYPLSGIPLSGIPLPDQCLSPYLTTPLSEHSLTLINSTKCH